MKIKLSKTKAKTEIDAFFQKKSFSAGEVRKIKKIAMKFNIKLKDYKKKFCKKCLSKLEGKTRAGKIYKTVECAICGYRNKFKMARTS
jgi:RNase P subunit RPR2